MPKTLNESFDQLAKDMQEAGINWADEAVLEAAREALKKGLNPLYTSISNLGFGAAQSKLQKEVTDANAAKTAAEGRATKAEADLKAEREKTPEIATVNQQWERELEKERTTHATEKTKLNDRIRNVLLQRDQKDLENELVALKVPRAMAKVLAKDPDLLTARADYDENGTLSVRQAGQQIPMAPASGQTYLGLLAAEVVATVDKDVLVSDGDRGSGVTGGAQPGRGDRSAFFKGVAERAKQEQQGETPKVPLAERIKNR